jgi:hypothetical protein
MVTRRSSDGAEDEVKLLWGCISSSVDRILLCLDGLGEDDLNWRPLDSANSLFVIAAHMIANVESNIQGILCGEKIARRREEEFKARGTADDSVQQRWRELKASISQRLAQLPTGALDREYQHARRGSMTGRELLVRVVIRHAAEHVGHAELTRDLLYAARGRELPKRDSFGHPVAGLSPHSNVTR